MSRPTHRWWECLRSIKPGGEPIKTEIAEGKDVHKQLESMWPEYQHEEPSIYHDEALPFDIIYHPDLYDEATNTVIEIKPYWWFWKNVEYCVAQLSGYMHFKGAKGLFRLYKVDNKGEVTSTADVAPPYTYDWPRLMQITLASIPGMEAVGQAR